MVKLCKHYCIVDRTPDDPRYIHELSNGKKIQFPKIIWELNEIGKRDNLKESRKKLKEIRNLHKKGKI